MAARRLRQIGSSPLGFTTIPSCAEISPRLSKSRFARKTFFEFRVGEWNGLVRVGEGEGESSRVEWLFFFSVIRRDLLFCNLMSLIKVVALQAQWIEDVLLPLLHHKM